MPHIMLDLETMGAGSDAAIVAIGAIEFDLAASRPGEEFYQVISLSSAAASGGKLDPQTVVWWLSQSPAAQGIFREKGHAHRQVLLEFANWLLQRGPEPRIWGNGAGFDNIILSSAYRREGLLPPWNFRHNRCFRTLKNLPAPDNLKPARGIKHNALEDARYQAQHLLNICRHLGIKEIN